MGSVNNFAINEAVNLLARVSPDRLGTLQSEFPELRKQLAEGTLMGTAQPDVRLVMNTLSVEALKAAEQECVAFSEAAKKRISIAETLKLIGQLIALVFSATTLALVGLDADIAAKWTAFGAVLGSILGLASDRLLALIDTRAGSLQTAYLKIVSLRERVRGLARLSTVYGSFPPSEQVQTDFFNQVNAVCAEVNESAALVA